MAKCGCPKGAKRVKGGRCQRTAGAKKGRFVAKVNCKKR